MHRGRSVLTRYRIVRIAGARTELDDYGMVKVNGTGRTCMCSDPGKSLRQGEVPEGSRLLWTWQPRWRWIGSGKTPRFVRYLAGHQ